VCREDREWPVGRTRNEQEDSKWVERTGSGYTGQRIDKEDKDCEIRILFGRDCRTGIV